MNVVQLDAVSTRYAVLYAPLECSLAFATVKPLPNAVLEERFLKGISSKSSSFAASIGWVPPIPRITNVEVITKLNPPLRSCSRT